MAVDTGKLQEFQQDREEGNRERSTRADQGQARVMV